MELLNKKEHLSCPLYDNRTMPLIKYEEWKSGSTFILDQINSNNQMVFLLKGRVFYSYNYQTDTLFEPGTFLVFSRKSKCRITVEEDCAVVVVSQCHSISFCSHFSLEMLSAEQKKQGEDAPLYPLKANKRILDYLDNFVATLSDGLKCILFLDLKQRELFYYLQAYYPKKDLAKFFAPILSRDIQFSEIIFQNYAGVKTVEELAKSVNYSVSGFKQRFLKTFGISPSQWLNKEKAKKLYYEISCTKRTFSEIAVEYDFSSTAHFSAFCKKMYGMTPKILRENMKQRVLMEE